MTLLIATSVFGGMSFAYPFLKHSARAPLVVAIATFLLTVVVLVFAAVFFATRPARNWVVLKTEMPAGAER